MASKEQLQKAVKTTLVTYMGTPEKDHFLNIAVDILSFIIGTKPREEVRQILTTQVAALIEDKATQGDCVEDLLHVKDLFESNQLLSSQTVQPKQKAGSVLNPHTGRRIQRGGRTARLLGL